MLVSVALFSMIFNHYYKKKDTKREAQKVSLIALIAYHPKRLSGTSIPQPDVSTNTRLGQSSNT